jgi:hypothetical protein
MERNIQKAEIAPEISKLLDKMNCSAYRDEVSDIIWVHSEDGDFEDMILDLFVTISRQQKML